MLTTVIIDDEKNSRIVLKNLLNELYPEIQILGEAADSKEGYKVILETKPQLVFLDIQMPGGNGFTLLKKWNDIPFEVIFVTSYDQYAISAIKFSALDYLLKPIEIPDLQKAIEKAIKSIASKEEKQIQIINLLNNVNKDNKARKIMVHDKDRVKLLTVDKIGYIESDDSYCHITMTHGEKYTTSKFLKDFEEFFLGNNDFIRIHKRVMININFIHDYSKGEPCVLSMEDNKTFEVARRKKQEVLERLKRK